MLFAFLMMSYRLFILLFNILFSYLGPKNSKILYQKKGGRGVKEKF